MKDYVEIAPTPADEPLQEVGNPEPEQSLPEISRGSLTIGRIAWSLIGFILCWPKCKTCERRLIIFDRSEEYCNDHTDDDLGLGGI